MFRRKASDGEHAQPLASAICAIRVAVGDNRTGWKAAAMEVKKGLIVWRHWPRYPFAIDATGGDAFAR